MTIGYLRRLSIGGIDFDVVADADIDTKMDINVEGVPTSGEAMLKFTKQIAEGTGFKAVYNKGNVNLLEGMIRNAQPLPIFYTDQNGDDFNCTGLARIDSKSTMNGEINITVIPLSDWV